MIWNHALHLFAGVLGVNIMTWSAPGVIASLVVASVTQAIHMIRLYFDYRNRFQADPVGFQAAGIIRPGSAQYWLRFGQFYVAKVIWYAFVTLAAAHIMRFLSA